MNRADERALDRFLSEAKRGRPHEPDLPPPGFDAIWQAAIRRRAERTRLRGVQSTSVQSTSVPTVDKPGRRLAWRLAEKWTGNLAWTLAAAASLALFWLASRWIQPTSELTERPAPGVLTRHASADTLDAHATTGEPSVVLPDRIPGAAATREAARGGTDLSTAASLVGLHRVSTLPMSLQATFRPHDSWSTRGVLYVAGDYLAMTSCDQMGTCLQLVTEAIASAHCTNPGGDADLVGDGVVLAEPVDTLPACVVRTRSCEGTLGVGASSDLSVSLRSLEGSGDDTLCAQFSGTFKKLGSLTPPSQPKPARRHRATERYEFATAKVSAVEGVDEERVRQQVVRNAFRFNQCYEHAEVRGLTPGGGIWISLQSGGGRNNVQVAFARGEYDQELERCIVATVRRFRVPSEASFSVALLVL